MMIGLYAIMSDYCTILRDYFSDQVIFPMIIAHGTIIFPIIFPIMSNYFTLFFLLFLIMSWCRHPENGNVQTAILDPIMKE